MIFGGLLFWGTFWKYDASAYSVGYYYMYICPWVRLFDYVEGILLSLIFKQKELESDSLVWDGAWLMECTVFLASIFSLQTQSLVSQVYRWSVMWLPISLGLVWCFVSMRGNVTIWLSKQESLLWLGARSFELYVTHRMILLFFARYSTGQAYFLAIFTCLIVVEAIYQGKGFLEKKI